MEDEQSPEGKVKQLGESRTPENDLVISNSMIHYSEEYGNRKKPQKMGLWRMSIVQKNK